jgi:hypothetical protein
MPSLGSGNIGGAYALPTATPPFLNIMPTKSAYFMKKNGDFLFDFNLDIMEFAL